MESKRKTVLVVGDWVVDEHWIVAHDRSTTASRRGQHHYHAVHEPTSSVAALCGAGIVASLLREARLQKEQESPQFNVHGIGAWAPGDQEALASMLSPGGLDGHNPFRSTTPPLVETTLPTVKLHNVCADLDAATTRVIRVYLEEGRTIRHLYRLDWYKPPRPQSSNSLWLATEREVDEWWEGADLADIRPDVIVIKDLVKGVVSPALVKKLVSAYGRKTPHWYISSKAWHLERQKDSDDEWYLSGDSWLAELTGQVIPLMLVPAVAAERARHERSLNAWCVDAREPSWHAMLVMDALAKALSAGKKAPDIAVLAEHALFLRTLVGDECKLVARVEPGRYTGHVHNFEEFVPLASVFFSALIAHMEAGTGVTTAGDALADAITFTETWVAAEARRFTIPGPWTPSKEHRPLTVSATPPAAGEAGRQSWRDWRHELTDWRQARQGLGILEARHGVRTRPAIELRRAMTDVAGYICLVPDKRRAVRSLKRELRRFKDHFHGRKHGVSLLLEAEPGSGKTFLLDRIAEDLGMKLAKYNVAQWTTLSEVIASFDDIVSRQSEDADHPLIVFVDEINTQVEGSHVYQLFLDPLEQGTYISHGRRFSIRPCAWVFAGTGIEDGHPETKGSDFKSRLSVPPLRFYWDDSEKNHDFSTLERVYVGAQNIIRIFPEVKSASEAVLRGFTLLPSTTSFRDQMRFVMEFEQKMDRIHKRHVPLTFVDELWERPGRRVSVEGERAPAEHDRHHSDYRRLREEWRRADEGRDLAIITPDDLGRG